MAAAFFSGVPDMVRSHAVLLFPLNSHEPAFDDLSHACVDGSDPPASEGCLARTNLPGMPLIHVSVKKV